MRRTISEREVGCRIVIMCPLNFFFGNGDAEKTGDNLSRIAMGNAPRQKLGILLERWHLHLHGDINIGNIRTYYIYIYIWSDICL